MKSGFKIMDSDMHLREPADLWAKYMEPEWRDQAPNILSSTARSSAMVLLDGRILTGTKPADLPVEAPMKFEMKNNLQTAKTLGLTIRPIVLMRAQKVIR